MNKLTKLTIKKFRNVEPTAVEFSPGLNVLLGKNAAGKTTLLRLLSTVVTRSEEAFRDDVFEVSYRASGETLDVEHTIKKERVSEPALRFEPLRATREGLPSTQQADSLVFFDREPRAIVLNAKILSTELELEWGGKPFKTHSPFARTQPFQSVATALPGEDLPFRSAIYSAAIHSAGRMDESLEWFNGLLEFEVETTGNLFSLRSRSFSETLFNQIALQYTSSPGTSTTFSFGFLDRAARVLGYDSAFARLDIERLSPEPGVQNIRMSNLRFFFKRANEEISHDLLSYGQKRLLAFFAYADASMDVIITDELVNGLHHEWIKACLDEIGPRQAFLTSQNPLLLDFLRFESAEQVRRTFILCERVQQEAGAQLVWRNPTPEEAESFFAAYQTGIQRVSDILLTKGLW